MTNKIKIPTFRDYHLKPRKQKRVPVVLTPRVTAGGKRVLEAPPVCEVKRPWVWGRVAKF